MKNQTCLHFGVSKISLDNPSGEFKPETILLYNSKIKSNPQLFMLSIEKKSLKKVEEDLQ